MTNLGLVRIVGIVEGISTLALFFIAMPLKWLGGITEAVRYPGLVHGLLWLAYLVVVIVAYGRGKLPGKWVGILFAASIVPFGPFWADGKLKKMELGKPAQS